MQLAREEPPTRPLGREALKAAMRFNASGALALWRQRFDETDDAAQRVRLALLGLRAAPWLSEPAFQDAAAGQIPLVATILQGAWAISAERLRGPEVQAMIGAQHPLINTWLLSFAKDSAPAEDGRWLLSELIRRFRPEPRRSLARRVDSLVRAAQALAEADAQAAEATIWPMLEEPNAAPLRSQALLMGLFGARGVDLSRALRRLPQPNNPDLEGLWVMLRAKHGHRLDGSQFRSLSLIVRGGMGLSYGMRLHAGWLYADQAGLLESLLQRVLTDDP
jgi:hypothetical protein